ncbi:MAG TPA: hypothetical protein VFX20_16990 [Steroidobacteraceae bacterium]|nr:hypothetical protein [Steroidobacteraceae bacterium]
MPSFRFSAIPAALAAAVLLTGCAWSGGFAADPPPGLHLAGDWKLNSARSDDLGKAIETLRAQSAQRRRNARSEQSQDVPGDAAGPPSGHRRTRRGQQGEPSASSGYESGYGAEGEEFGTGPPGSSVVDELMSNVPRGDYLRIGVSADSFTVTSGDSSDRYTPGLESDISAEQGDARQMSGWKKSGYVIDTKPQIGAELIQSYSLAKDGKLIMTLQLTGGRLKRRFTYTRVYDRTTGVTPLAPPTIN